MFIGGKKMQVPEGGPFFAVKEKHEGEAGLAAASLNKYFREKNLETAFSAAPVSLFPRSLVRIQWWRGGEFILESDICLELLSRSLSGEFETGTPEMEIICELLSLDTKNVAPVLQVHFPMFFVQAKVKKALILNEKTESIIRITPHSDEVSFETDYGGRLDFFPGTGAESSFKDLYFQLYSVVAGARGWDQISGKSVRLKGFLDKARRFHPFAIGHLRQEFWAEPVDARRSALHTILREFGPELPEKGLG